MATIAQVNQDRITTIVRPVDLLITSLHDNKLRGTYCLSYCKTTLMLANMLYKPLDSNILLDKVLWAVWHRFYPPYTSENFRLLQLDIYPIGTVYPLHKVYVMWTFLLYDINYHVFYLFIKSFVIHCGRVSKIVDY